MESLEKRVAKLEFHQSLLMEMVDEAKKPFYSLIIRADLTKEEVDAFLSFCQELAEQYEQQKAEGLTIFTPLLVQFAGMLHPNLPLEQTVDAMLAQQMFVPLMTELKTLIRTVS
ncbi:MULTISPECIES: YhaI family protein [Geobacillus]|mgnify:FL=1|jgi:hypothetical protein|uniref:Uncharacterized protein n=4 Tax=Geobacillus TaxID=129337 RepID=A4IKU0_GEOTN|nr:MULTISPECIES: YhaI family protein [Geobacillus]ABO65944.1 Conserved hypothetical protein [Geobacillus thermodenitrificans NG80-2]AMX84459.1 hypothetical protein GS3922_12745 [Geobacillus subterraneus]ARA97617.1 hypothetical protein GD3902_05760 [Geobacillus thermodenitrificans]ARP41676.1 hypothetical protein GTHT12_00111 [Geobacillus thermodenitrificans]ATO36944.1 hypothetical protein GTID1_06660 [Geobacillus thermodenitrificans]